MTFARPFLPVVAALTLAAASVTLTGCTAADAKPTKAAEEPAPLKVLVQALSGSDDPTTATLAFVGAFGAAEAGHDVTMVLAGEAANLIDPDVARSTVGVGLGSVDEWFGRIDGHGIEVYVCGACAKGRGVDEADLEARNATLITAKDFGVMVGEHDRVISY